MIRAKSISARKPECASDKSNRFIPLSMANFMMDSASASETVGENTDHVPRPTLDTLSPLLPKFLKRKPGVVNVFCLIGKPAELDPTLYVFPSNMESLSQNKIVYSSCITGLKKSFLD